MHSHKVQAEKRIWGRSAVHIIAGWPPAAPCDGTTMTSAPDEALGNGSRVVGPSAAQTTSGRTSTLTGR